MEFGQTINILNRLLVDKNPITFNSSWILEHAPKCYRFINKNIRTETGRIDWDKVTYSLEWKFQRRWRPARRLRKSPPYKDVSEVNAVLNQYRDKLYAFIAPCDRSDKRIRNIISVSLVRLAQCGNLLAKEEIMKLARYTIDDWIQRYRSMSRWEGYDKEIEKHLEGCIRRYRYTGSFLNYLFRTLQYAGRGLQALCAFSLDEPIVLGSTKRWLENVYQNVEMDEVRIHRGTGRGQ